MITFLTDYLIWHYTKGIFDLIKNIKTFFWFNNFLFAYKFLIKTLFSSFMRIKEKKLDIFSFESIITFFIVNGLMRLIGFIFRSVIFILGLVLLAITIIVSIIVLIIWITFPVFIIALLIDSIYIILK